MNEGEMPSPVSHYAVISEPPYPPKWRVSPHQHEVHEIGLVKRGSCFLTLPHGEYAFSTHEVFFFPSLLPHGFWTTPDSEVEFVVVQFTTLHPFLLAELVNTPPIGRFTLFPLEVSLFLDLVHQLQRECAGGLPWSELQCQALLQEIVVLLLRSHRRGKEPYLNPEQQRAIESALAVIHHRSHENLKMKELAESLGFSPQHFRDLFRRYVGKSPKAYLTALKLQRSKCMLLHGEYKINDIALRLGFGNAGQFSKVFRKNTGLTPQEWRRVHSHKERSLPEHLPEKVHP